MKIKSVDGCLESTVKISQTVMGQYVVLIGPYLQIASLGVRKDRETLIVDFYTRYKPVKVVFTGTNLKVIDYEVINVGVTSRIFKLRLVVE